MKKLINAKILIVGGAGFVGSNLVFKLLNYKIKNIYIIDNLLSADLSNIPKDKRVIFLKGSITNQNILKRIPNDINFIWHLACYHGNQASIINPLKDHENNLFTTLRLYDYIKKFKNLVKVVYSSAGCSFAEKTYDQPIATDEKYFSSLYQDSPYSISKLAGDIYSLYYHRSHNLPVVIARFQNVYGEREILGAGKWRGHISTVWRNVIPTFIWQALNNYELKLENSGENSRDFIHVSDIVNGLILCAVNGKEGKVYNLGTGKETKIRDLATKTINYTKSTSKIIYLPQRLWDTSGRRFASIKNSKINLGFSCKINIDKGLKQTIQWSIKNKDLIKKNILKHKKYLKL